MVGVSDTVFVAGGCWYFMAVSIYSHIFSGHGNKIYRNSMSINLITMTTKYMAINANGHKIPATAGNKHSIGNTDHFLMLEIAFLFPNISSAGTSSLETVKKYNPVNLSIHLS